MILVLPYYQILCTIQPSITTIESFHSESESERPKSNSNLSAQSSKHELVTICYFYQLKQYFLAFILWLVYYWIFRRVGIYFPITSIYTADDRLESALVFSRVNFLFTECFSRVAILGVTMMAFISGFGMASAPFIYFSNASLSLKPPTDSKIDDSKNKLKRLHNSIQYKRQKLIKMLTDNLDSSLVHSNSEFSISSDYQLPGPRLTATIISKIFTFFRPPDKLRLQQEIHSLEFIESQLIMDIEEMIDEKVNFLPPLCQINNHNEKIN